MSSADKQLFRDMRACAPGAAERRRLRDRIVSDHLSLANCLARQLAHRREQLPDVMQVAAIGLIHAVDRFDPDRGPDFRAFAVPTIRGEIKRFFRDTDWLLRVPRSCQELQTRIERASNELAQDLHREPAVEEIADSVGVGPREIREARDAALSHHSVPMDVLTDQESGDRAPSAVAATQGGYDVVELRAVLRPVIAELPQREREILALRFVGDRTQAEIAKVMGVSQMQISRLVARTLGQLRESLGVPA